MRVLVFRNVTFTSFTSLTKANERRIARIRQFRRGAWMAGFSGCMRERVSGRGAALAEGRRAGYPTPIVRAVSCYETRRDETSKRGRGSRARRRGFTREREGEQRLSSQPSDGQTDGLRVLSFLLSRTFSSFSSASIFASPSLVAFLRARALPSQNHLCMPGRSPRQ